MSRLFPCFPISFQAKKGFSIMNFYYISFVFFRQLHMRNMITLGTRQKQILNKQAMVGVDRFQ